MTTEGGTTTGAAGINPAGGTTTPPPAAGGSGAGSGGSTPTQWYDGFQPELKGYIQNKQFKDSAALAEAYKNLESLNGSPDKLVKLPANAEDKDGWNQVYSKLGRPVSKDKYEIPMPEKNADPNMKTWAQDAFFEAGLNGAQAKTLSEKWNAYVEGIQTNANQERETQMANQEAALKREWGGAYEQNVKVASQAARTLGIEGPIVEKLEQVLGVDGTFKLFHKLGAQVGEDTFIEGMKKGGSFGNALTPEQASARLSDLKGDSGWVKKYLEGDRDARGEMDRLQRFIAAGHA